MRLIKINFPTDQTEAVTQLVEKAEPIDWSIDSGYGRYEKAIEIIIADGSGQTLLDDLQAFLGQTDNWRINVLPVEATLPRPAEPINTSDIADKEKTTSLREELYQDISKDCNFNWDFVILTVLSTIVATIGLNVDSVTIVIAAMVIAPLLGPILAFALGVALGDISLMLKSSRTAISGLSIGFITALIISLFIPLNLQSAELMDRTILGPEIIVLALASGAAAALSISTGLSSALVGVMVAVALLPPSVASAMFLAAGEHDNAFSAGLLTALNVVCALLSAQLVFVYKGIRPRTRAAQQTANRAVKINAAIWITLLVALTLLSVKLTA